VGELEPFPTLLIHSDEGIFRQCQEGGDERGGTTVEPSDAAMAENGPSLRVAMRRASASLRVLPDVPHRASTRAWRTATPHAQQSGSIESGKALNRRRNRIVQSGSRRRLTLVTVVVAPGKRLELFQLVDRLGILALGNPKLLAQFLD